MLGSKLGWILAGRTTETVENTAEPSMLIITYGTDINKETTLMTLQITHFLGNQTWMIFGGWSRSEYRNLRQRVMTLKH